MTSLMMRALLVTTVALLAACAADVPTNVASTEPIAVVVPNTTQGAIVGVPFRYDASRGHTVFSDPRRTGLSYSIAGVTAGLSASGREIVGTPTTPGVQLVAVTARDSTGRTAVQEFRIVVFAADLTTPTLPTEPFGYSNARAPVPRHLTGGINPAADNTPAANPVTDAGATLGRVLFYDRRLSRNDRVACASCHLQSVGFTDTVPFSRGFAGGVTSRHSMALGNARWYAPGRFFWDHRAATLEDQVLQPIADEVEMGLTQDQLVAKVEAASFYAPLLTAAFGTAEVTPDRLARALAQFVRSLVTGRSRFDRAFELGPPNAPNFDAVFTPLERQGLDLFNGRAGCARCHVGNAHVSEAPINTGLDAISADIGAGGARFKAPSIRNVGVRTRFMHDGRFTSLEQVVDFYNSGVQANPGLDARLRTIDGRPIRLNLSLTERDALVAFMRTLTDSTFLADPRFSDPFRR
jgi:cytochrome c peroxidase